MSNLSKETKQLIALNYSIFKNTALKNNVIKKLQKLIECLKNSALNKAGITKSEISNLINDINNSKNTKLINSFYTDSFNINGLGSFPVIVDDLNISINTQNKIFCYYKHNNKIEYNNKVLNINTFNYDGFSFSLQKLLMEDTLLNKLFIDFKENEKNLFECLQNSYDNCYELIRSIRTLDRIEKNFPEVLNYIPENIIYNNSNNSLKEKFKKL